MTDNNEVNEQQPEQQMLKELTPEQKEGALRFAHRFFGEFDRVPGFMTSQWAQALDAIGVVINSLILERGGDKPNQ